MKTIDLDKYGALLDRTETVKMNGRVTQVIGLLVESHGPAVSVGELCLIHSKLSDPEEPILAEVVGFKPNSVLLMPLGDIAGIGPGSIVERSSRAASMRVGRGLLGRILDGLGNPLDGQPLTDVRQEYPIYHPPLNPLLRKRITEPLGTGIKCIDGLLTLGKGQRVGIFAGSGVGKSTLLGMIARNSSADVNVIALIGERGREVNDFLERDLGKEGLMRSVVVAATSDQSPLVRMRGAFVATAIAEYFRDQGANVFLMMDSVTRFAMSHREIGLAVGEPPTTKGYTPSVFATLPKLLERAGNADGPGSITGLYTVLVEADDMNDPIADAARSILDGHIVLSRDLATRNHFPAIDALESISRLMPDIVSREHYAGNQRLRQTLAAYRKSEDLINIGAYVAGSSKDIDYAISMYDPINNYLRQATDVHVRYNDAVQELTTLFPPAN
ncbi:MAG: flagellar protein export ATPase FliI [Nitrospirota bacterium]|nr:flagellar protein export ATPase FliI [Nitrospirota bacterium]